MVARGKSEAARSRHLPFLAMAARGILPSLLDDLRRAEKEQMVMKRVAKKISGRKEPQVLSNRLPKVRGPE